MSGSSQLSVTSEGLTLILASVDTPTYIHMTQTSHKQTRNLFLNDYFYIIKQIYLYYYILFCGFLLFITAHILSVSSVDQLSIQWLYKYCNRINTTDLYLFSVMFKIL